MNFSELKLGLYDIFGFVVPGFLVICEIWVSVTGWPRFVTGISGLNGAAMTVLLFASVAVGPIVQELADTAIKRLKSDRFFKATRDEIWKSPFGREIEKKLERETGIVPPNVDDAYEMCFSLVSDRATRHDLFLAQSAMARSLLVVSVLFVLPAATAIAKLSFDPLVKIAAFTGLFAVCCLIVRLCWTRMCRFRKLAIQSVFQSYMAHATKVMSAKA